MAANEYTLIKAILSDSTGATKKYIAPWYPNATTQDVGLVKPDGDTITIDENGVISANVSGGGSITIDTALDAESENAVQNKAIYDVFESMLDSLTLQLNNADLDEESGEE